MKKIYISIGIVLTLVISGFTVSAATFESNQNEILNPDIILTGFTEDEPKTVDLIADGGSADTAFVVGYIEVWNDDNTLYIEYFITEPGWEMTLTHVHIGEDLDDFPLTKGKHGGNPQIGKFDFQKAYNPAVTWDLISIPYDVESLIAVHADVQKICDWEGDIAGIEVNLPDQVTFKVTYPYGGGPAYFPHTYINGIDGVSDIYSWCVDTDNVIYQNTWYTANVYSSYETIPAGYIEHPENLDLVNWILNQGYIGTPSPGCSGVYTYGDVQRAIWQLVEDTQSTAGLGSWSQCRVNEILTAAYANGEGFIPECGDIIGIILVPVNGAQKIIAQAVVGEIEVPCIPIYCSETAWAQGPEFPGSSWAMYFEYIIGVEDDVISKENQLRNLLAFLREKITIILENLRRV